METLNEIGSVRKICIHIRELIISDVDPAPGSFWSVDPDPDI